MKIKEGFVLREVAGQTMVIAIGEISKTFKGMIKLNATAKDIWLYIEKGLTIDEIINEMIEKYDVSKDIIEKDILKIIELMKVNHIIEE